MNSGAAHPQARYSSEYSSLQDSTTSSIYLKPLHKWTPQVPLTSYLSLSAPSISTCQICLSTVLSFSGHTSISFTLQSSTPTPTLRIKTIPISGLLKPEGLVITGGQGQERVGRLCVLNLPDTRHYTVVSHRGSSRYCFSDERMKAQRG